MSKPPSRTTEIPSSMGDSAVATRGLLEIPSEPASNGKHSIPGMAPPGPQLPQSNDGAYGNNGQGYASGYSPYRPPPAPSQSGMSRGLIIGLSLGGVALVALLGTLFFLVLREKPEKVTEGAVAMVTPPPATEKPKATPPKAVEEPPAPTGSNGQALPKVRPKAEVVTAKEPAPAEPERRTERRARTAESLPRASERPRPREAARTTTTTAM